ncbi:MAG: hypothetical protein QM756_44780 [Polyangiaceae bacterium]
MLLLDEAAPRSAMPKEKSTEHPEEPGESGFAHWEVAAKLHEIAAQLEGAVVAHRTNVRSPFKSMRPTASDAQAVVHLLEAMAMSLAGFDSWEPLRRAHAALRGSDGEQSRKDAAIARCEETLTAWRQLERKRKRRESEEDHERRVKATKQEEAWLVRALTMSLTALGYNKPRNVKAALARFGQRSNGSALSLASVLLGLSRDSFENAKRKKRHPRSK